MLRLSYRILECKTEFEEKTGLPQLIENVHPNVSSQKVEASTLIGVKNSNKMSKIRQPDTVHVMLMIQVG